MRVLLPLLAVLAAACAAVPPAFDLRVKEAMQGEYGHSLRAVEGPAVTFSWALTHTNSSVRRLPLCFPAPLPPAQRSITRAPACADSAHQSLAHRLIPHTHIGTHPQEAQSAYRIRVQHADGPLSGAGEPSGRNAQ